MSKAMWKEEDASAELLCNASKNLARLMERAGVDAAQLSQKTGLGVATINNIRRGVGNPTLLTLMELARFFDIKLSDFIEGELGRDIKPLRAVLAVPLIKFTEIALFLSGVIIESDHYFIDAAGFNAQDAFAVLLNNDSLFPNYSQGSVFIVAREERPADGDVVLVSIAGQPPCFRRMFVDGDQCLFSSISLMHDLQPFVCRDFKIVGVAVKAIKTFSAG
ncbi:LexA family transcriptional regulator [Chromobacterium alticapitis]|uniref:DNA-binding protein n=1 Tax=Chromobacterium alticapitis TaxID=2073169 RepID=A0A2S5DEJ7_9NEIS|nr:LexA family transcriptional regulator [Chromobacterium alticapitis]POZ61397.1 DNA-binding protein [Chromobacterium alticapitis]